MPAEERVDMVIAAHDPLAGAGLGVGRKTVLVVYARAGPPLLLAGHVSPAVFLGKIQIV